MRPCGIVRQLPVMDPSARQIALLRALTEAAQTRLTVISGLRDDFRGDTYEQLQDLEVVRTIRDRITASKAARRFSDVPTGTQTH